jgi:hypothetical protein
MKDKHFTGTTVKGGIVRIGGIADGSPRKHDGT